LDKASVRPMNQLILAHSLVLFRGGYRRCGEMEVRAGAAEGRLGETDVWSIADVTFR